MLSCTPKFLRSVRNSGKRKTVICVTESFGTSYLFENVNIISGSMTIDRNSDVRRTASLEIGDTELNDLFFTNPTGPFGVEIEIYSGIVYSDGSEELLKMGVFSVEDYSFQDVSGTGWPQMQLFDRSQWIHRSPFAIGRDFSGMLSQSVIEQVIEEVIPTVSIVFEPGLTNPRLPGGSMYDSSRWDVVKACCELLGAEAYFDSDGVLRVSAVKDPTAVPSSASWEFSVGSGFSEIQGSASDGEEWVTRPEGVLTNIQRSVTRAATFNAVSVYGSAPSATTGQPYALAYDNDPLSPTYYNGPFGKSVKRMDNQLLTTSVACGQAAATELKNTLGFARSVDFQALANPAIEAGDYILFSFPDESQEVHLLDSCTHPFGPGDFSGNTRTNPTRQTSSVSISRGTNTFDLRPEAPGKPVVTGVTNNTVTLKWTASQAGSTDVAKYDILVNHQVRRSVTSPTLTAVVGGLYPGNTYTFTVRAVDKAGLVSNESLSTAQKTTGAYIADPGVGGITHTKTYPAFWSATYLGSSAEHHNERATQFGTHCYQGTGQHGTYRSLIGFDEGRIAADLLGADILSVSVKLHYFDWQDTDHAGTAIIGTHKFASRPNIWASTSVKPDRVRSAGWRENTTRVVNLGIAVGEEFASGLTKGISIGPAPTGQPQYLGGARGASSGSLTPQLIITYRK